MRDDIQKEYQDKTARIEEQRAKTQKDSSLIAKEKASIQSIKQDLEVINILDKQQILRYLILIKNSIIYFI